MHKELYNGDISKILLSLSSDIIIIKNSDLRKDIYDCKLAWYSDKYRELIDNLSNDHIRWITPLTDKKKGIHLAYSIYKKDIYAGNIMYNLHVILSELENLKYRQEKSIEYKKIRYDALL